MAGEIHIPSLAPEVVGHLGVLPITNTMVNTWIAAGLLLVFGIILSAAVKLRPGRLQNASEFFLEGLFVYFDQVTGERRKTMRFLPIVGSVFLFILLSNWLGLLPGTNSIMAGHAPLLRPANTDLNLTVAMALVSVASAHLLAFGTIGFFAHLNKFVQIGTIFKSITKGPIAIFTALVEFVIGLIEIIGEVAKVVSLSLRLFGNIFAGEVLISVISALAAALIPTPFILLELLVGLIQAGVFAMLTLVYMTVSTAAPHGAESH